MTAPFPRLPWSQRIALADRAVRRALAQLPPELREPAEGLPVTYERHPSPEVCEAPEDREQLLGLFVGAAYPWEEDGSVPLPPQILLFLDNLEDMTGPDPAAFQEEVRVTYLHELGHYLGLDEDELEARGLA